MRQDESTQHHSDNKATRPNCASEGTAAFGVSSDGAAVAELAPLSGAFMSLAICKACVEDFLLIQWMEETLPQLIGGLSH